MDFRLGHKGHEDDIRSLFTQSFGDAAGAEEGAAISAFVTDMMQTTPPDDLVVWSAYDGDVQLGGAMFSRMRYPQDARTVFIMSPVAVRSKSQKSGVGQRLIRHGLDDLRARGVDVVLTYGDPQYYGKTGFAQISEQEARPPLTLSQPEGWLMQALTEAGAAPLKGPSHCVPALEKPELW